MSLISRNLDYLQNICFIVLVAVFAACSSQCFDVASVTFTIMIDPAGDARHAGRAIGDSFERSLTLQCAEKIKHEIEANYPSIFVVITRLSGEAVQPLQNANFANRLGVDLYVSLNFYQECRPQADLSLLVFSEGDDVLGFKRTDPLSFVSLDQAHKQSMQKSLGYANLVNSSFAKSEHKLSLVIHDVLKCPFKPLLGIMAPAIGIELGLRQKNDWMGHVPALIDALVSSAHQGRAS